jgi:hypothetical protein
MWLDTKNPNFVGESLLKFLITKEKQIKNDLALVAR